MLKYKYEIKNRICIKDKDINNIEFDLINKNVKTILAKNFNRSRFECQRLAKCNSDIWETLITLTIENNISDLNIAYKYLRSFIAQVQRKLKDFKYIGVPEFQKRGAVHYHLLTNISIDNDDLIYSQVDNEKFKHIKYWNLGFTRIDNVNGNIKKITGYISKYMSDNIDDRLFNHRRYYYSQNLNKPVVSYIDTNNEKHMQFLFQLLKDKKVIFESKYNNYYSSESITFKEFL